MFSLLEAITSQNTDTQERIEIIDTIYDISKENIGEVTGKITNYIKKKGKEDYLRFILHTIANAAFTRPKEREAIMMLISSLKETFHLNENDFFFNRSVAFNSMVVIKRFVSIKNVSPRLKIFIRDNTIFELFKEESIGQIILNDDVEKLQLYLINNPSDNIYCDANLLLDVPNTSTINPLQCSEILSSIKCFKYLMINANQLSSIDAKISVAGGNFEIIHILEQKGVSFKSCLPIAAIYYRNDISEWLNNHFSCDAIPPDYFGSCNETLFYYFEEEIEKTNMTSVLLGACSIDNIEFIKYLLEKYKLDGSDCFTTAAKCGNINVIKYLISKGYSLEQSSGKNLLFVASKAGSVNFVKYLIDNGIVDPHVKNDNGNNALSYAKYHNVIELLKSHGL